MTAYLTSKACSSVRTVLFSLTLLKERMDEATLLSACRGQVNHLFSLLRKADARTRSDISENTAFKYVLH